jgi:hypothetical protein
VPVQRLGRQRNGGDDRHSSLDPRLAQRRKESHFIHSIQADAVGYLAQEALGGLDHGAALEARNLFIV